MKTSKISFPAVAKGVVPGATVASGLLSPLALAAPGDLDPAFGDLGRLGPILEGPAYTLDLQDDGSFLVAGGREDLCGWYCVYYWYYYSADLVPSNFVDLMDETGSIIPDFNAQLPQDMQVLDAAVLPGGATIAVGRKFDTWNGTTQLTVFRMHPDGLTDTTFGDAGSFQLSLEEHGTKQSGAAVILDPDGRIVVAGSQGDRLLVLRLLPDGSLDDAFGAFGFFAGPDNFEYSGARTSLLRTADGGYRVTASNAAGCQVVALTAAGVADPAFGDAGVATVDLQSGPSSFCSALLDQADGNLLVAGSADGHGFAARLLADGQPDASFAANPVTDAMAEASALALDDNGAVLVAGTGVSGASITRLQPDGTVDVLFGNSGATVIDLASDVGTSPVVHDLRVLPDGRILAAGGDDISRKTLVVRLLGPAGGDSPGVVGFGPQRNFETKEGVADVTVKVRRTGGKSGSVSVAYQTEAQQSVAGIDYVAIEGRLTWDDGDTTERELHVPILADTVTELPEDFLVTLSDVQGGVGLGTSAASIFIAADGDPFGQFNIRTDTERVYEPGQGARVIVSRDYYRTGAVSVTLTPVSGTATAGADFSADPVTLSWADGDNQAWFVDFAILDDSIAEQDETFTVQLSDPTGGAFIGPNSVAEFVIWANDAPSTKSKKGGGALGLLSLLALGIAGIWRHTVGAYRRGGSRPE